MAEQTGTGVKGKIRVNFFRVMKATVKAALVCVAYLILSRFIAPVSMMIPGLQQMIETFVVVYVVLMIVGDLTSGTILHFFFSGAKSAFVIVYLIVSLNTGIFEYASETVNLIIDLRVFLVIVMLLGFVGVAKSVLQAIRYVNERAELVAV